MRRRTNQRGDLVVPAIVSDTFAHTTLPVKHEAARERHPQLLGDTNKGRHPRVCTKVLLFTLTCVRGSKSQPGVHQTAAASRE